ncbi:hypothetical protein QBC36DRAFT_326167 [Triangularia setosa]|uniref:Uncharacterized protein n=1 Tax=Triangularia setosa TaxID=2587417 RepID=A0AAN6WAA5_9PEZI|nr:hypothetical protein QBC36DRAFT_326167 [Podospora setosa]
MRRKLGLPKGSPEEHRHINFGSTFPGRQSPGQKRLLIGDRKPIAVVSKRRVQLNSIQSSGKPCSPCNDAVGKWWWRRQQPWCKKKWLASIGIQLKVRRYLSLITLHQTAPNISPPLSHSPCHIVPMLLHIRRSISQQPTQRRQAFSKKKGSRLIGKLHTLPGPGQKAVTSNWVLEIIFTGAHKLHSVVPREFATTTSQPRA